MVRRRRIACMTATRADYPRVKSVLREISSRPTLELALIVTGMHLMKEFGHTVDEVEKDGFPIAARVEIFSGDDSPYGMAKAAARCTNGIAEALNRIRPDLFLLTVDRVETLAAAQAAALMNIPIAHIQGGEVTGTIDESIRHAVTKLAHLHFPATADAAERIIKMGEDPRHVYPFGCPYIDIIQSLTDRSKEDLSRRYGFDSRAPLALFLQHPVTTEYGQGKMQLSTTLEALQAFPQLEVIALYSNADAGGREMIETMRGNPKFHLFSNIPDEDFLSLMKHADFMIGNSSAAIREAPSFQLPAINIGTRQNGRLRAPNVLDVPHDCDQIREVIRRILFDEEFRTRLQKGTNPYGDGTAAKKIVDILEKIELDSSLVQKRIAY